MPERRLYTKAHSAWRLFSATAELLLDYFLFFTDFFIDLKTTLKLQADIEKLQRETLPKTSNEIIWTWLSITGLLTYSLAVRNQVNRPN